MEQGKKKKSAIHWPLGFSLNPALTLEKQQQQQKKKWKAQQWVNSNLLPRFVHRGLDQELDATLCGIAFRMHSHAACALGLAAYVVYQKMDDDDDASSTWLEVGGLICVVP